MKYLLILLLIPFYSFGFISEKEIENTFHINKGTSAFGFSKVIEREVKLKKMVRLNRVRCELRDVLYTNNKNPLALVIYVDNCTEQNVFSKKIKLSVVYLVGKEYFKRYDRTPRPRVVIFPKVAVATKGNIIGFIY